MIDIEIFLDGISKGYCTFNGENYTIKSLGYNITSKTYLVESLKNKYILKTLVEPNEIVMVNHILSNTDFNFKLPKVLYIDDSIILYEYVDYKVMLSKTNFKQVLDWVIEKNLFFRDKHHQFNFPSSSYDIGLSINSEEAFYKIGRADLVEKINSAKPTLEYIEIYSKTLPQIIQHYDFHIRNILINNSENDFKIIDWGEVKIGDGVIDIVYVLREMKVLGMSNEELDNWVEYCASKFPEIDKFREIFWAANLSRCIKTINDFSGNEKYREIFDWYIFLLDEIIEI
jgi:hypothetical protein